jgi:hypothetical protein
MTGIFDIDDRARLRERFFSEERIVEHVRAARR